MPKLTLLVGCRRAAGAVCHVDRFAIAQALKDIATLLALGASGASSRALTSIARR
jgi:hypothetical protein